MSKPKRKRYVLVDNAYNVEVVDRAMGRMSLRFEQPGLQVTLLLPDVWITYIADERHEHIKHRQEQVDRLKKAMRGDQ